MTSHARRESSRPNGSSAVLSVTVCRRDTRHMPSSSTTIDYGNKVRLLGRHVKNQSIQYTYATCIILMSIREIHIKIAFQFSTTFIVEQCISSVAATTGQWRALYSSMQNAVKLQTDADQFTNIYDNRRSNAIIWNCKRYFNQLQKR